MESKGGLTRLSLGAAVTVVIAALTAFLYFGRTAVMAESRVRAGWRFLAAVLPAFRVIRGFWRYPPGEVAGQRVGAW